MNRDTTVQSLGRRAFSLIELLVVILIIALIVAIVLPALSGVRAKSREMATRQLLQNVSQAISAFQLDNKRLPGRFAERDLGLPENGQGNARGLTSMENVLLELAGGEVAPGPTPPPPAGSFRVGPYGTAAQNIMFHPDSVGKNKYFSPPPQHYKAQDGSDVGTKVASSDATANNMGVKDLVDADGMPIIAWMSDSATIGPINSHQDVANIGSGTNVSARFYMNSNHALLNATRLGKKGINQSEASLIGFGGTGMLINKTNSLAAILGAPGSPKDVTQPCIGILPTATRGSFVLHAAGRNGVFLGREERGGALASTSGVDAVFYGMNFKQFPNTSLQDDQGRATSQDITKEFDDIIIAGS